MLLQSSRSLGKFNHGAGHFRGVGIAQELGHVHRQVLPHSLAVLKSKERICDRGSDRRLDCPPSHCLSVRDKEQKVAQHLTVCPSPTWKYPSLLILTSSGSCHHIRSISSSISFFTSRQCLATTYTSFLFRVIVCRWCVMNWAFHILLPAS